MGTKITEEKNLFAALNNCAFVSTKQDTIDKFIDTFTFLMDSTMIGVGVGFDTKGSSCHYKIYRPDKRNPKTFVVEDTREGWVDSLKYQLSSYLNPNQPYLKFDYSKIRPAGIPLKTFGGTSCGYGPLKAMHNLLEKELESRDQMGSREIVDIMNIIGKCVVSGNIRRVAEIAFGESQDQEFIELKNYQKNPERLEYGWVSNNSIFAELGMDYGPV